MDFSLRLSRAALLAAAAIILAGPAALPGGAAAQGAGPAAVPAAAPWDNKVKRFYGRGDPQQDIDRARRQLYDDPLRRLGVPENRLEGPHAPDAPAGAPPAFDPGVSRLDNDRDGAISREEYFQGRTRLITPGFRGEQRHRRHLDRLDSRFRDADRNRDGKVTPDELRRGGRF